MKIKKLSSIRERKTVKGVLREVRRLLDSYDNWHQGAYQSKKNDGAFCFCVNGAINNVAATPKLANEVRRVVNSVIPDKWLTTDACYRESASEGPTIGLNDGEKHKTARGAHKAILKTLDLALDAA